MLLQIINIMITGAMAGYIAVRESKYGRNKSLLLGMVFFTFSFLLDSIFWLITIGIALNVENLLIQIIGLLISKGIILAGLVFLKGTSKTIIEMEHMNEQESTMQFADIFSIVLAIFFVVITFLCQFWEKGVSGIVFKIIFILLFLVFFAGYIIFAYLNALKQREIRKEAEEIKAQREADVYLENVENNYQRTRELWHDLKNHINLIKVLLDEQKYAEAKDYLRVFNEDVDTLTLPVKSGNMVVDAILSDKLGRAKKEGVTDITLELCNLTGLYLKADEICGLLGNLLDNCLEANRKVMEGKFIRVICKEQESNYYIKVENKSSGGAGEELKTSKSDKRNQVGHGLGIRSVERIVHGCGGDLIVENGKDIFSVVVRLPKITNNPSNITMK